MITLESFYCAERGGFFVEHDGLLWNLRRDSYKLLLAHFSEEGHPRLRVQYVAKNLKDLGVFNRFSDEIDSIFDRKEEISRLRKGK
jgi:hypothetical protein